MRDHQSLAQEMDLFHFEEHSPGMVFWHPDGFKLFHTIENYMREIHTKYGYKEIRSPMMLNKTLWEKSGHWDKFSDNIFVVPTEDDNKQTYALKPMSCPAHIEIYNSTPKTYKDLPARYMEFGVVHRNESSGSLNGCMRLRQFTQDDAHIFCSEDQILSETVNYIHMVRETYAMFGFTKFDIKLALRPDQRIGSDEIWDKSEQALRDACAELQIEYTEVPNEGAFYGPKLEVTLQDSLNRDWQCGTIQVDFNLTGRLDAEYINNKDNKVNPVLIHHAVLGSLERWVGIMLENTGGRLPLWLAPTQVTVACITNELDEYASDVCRTLDGLGLRVELDLRSEKINKKIKEANIKKVSYMVIVGKRDLENKEVTIRDMKTGESTSMSRSELTSFYSHIR